MIRIFGLFGLLVFGVQSPLILRGQTNRLTAQQIAEIQAAQAGQAAQIQQLNTAMANAAAQATQAAELWRAQHSSLIQSATMTSRSIQTSEQTSESFAESDESAQTDGGGNAPLFFTNSAEAVLFDTLSSASNGVLPSWRDVRSSPAPTGTAVGIMISTNCPFTITRVSAEVILDDPTSVSNTEFEAGFFRNTNCLAIGMYADPEYLASDWMGTLSMTLTNLADGNWLLSVQLPTYGWGTNRLLTIRTVPTTDGPMTHLSFVTCGDAVPGITAYASDNTTSNMAQVALPKMQVWRSMIAPVQSPYFAPSAFAAPGSIMDVTYLPGYQLGASTNLNFPLDWETDPLGVWRTTVDSSQGTQFFLTRPDPSN